MNILYKAVKCTDWGINQESQKFIYGLTLEPVDNDYDIIQEEIDNTSGDVTIILPEEGLIEGVIYAVSAVNEKKDLMTEIVDDYDLQISRASIPASIKLHDIITNLIFADRIYDVTEDPYKREECIDMVKEAHNNLSLLINSLS